MCGSFNFITAKKIMDNSKANDEIIIFNKKIIPYFTKNKNAKIIKMLNTTTIPIHEIEILSSFLYSSYVADKYMSIKIVYSDVASNHSVNHKILEILPMDKSFLDLKVSSSNILFNDDKNDIAKIAFELYLNTIIISAIKDSIQAENIIRFNSMDMAQKNLKEIINDLEFNLLKAKEKRSNSDQISTFTSVEN
jgi:F0F1-type ATP synthase gamma subunit